MLQHALPNQVESSGEQPSDVAPPTGHSDPSVQCMQAQGRQPTVATLGLAAQGLGTCVIVHLPVHAIGKEVLDGHPQ